MDFVRQQLAVVQERLAALSASQKMLTAALAVIVVMTMLYWGKVSASPERIAVSQAVLAGDDLTAATSALRSAGVEYTVEGGKVMVAADKQVEALGAISQALPANSNAFDSMFDKVSPWDSQGAFDVRVTSARQQYIDAIIRTWDGVKKADVLITDAPNSSLSRREPRMAISIQTKGVDADRRRLGKLARNLAMGAVAGISEKFINVNVDMMTIGGDAGAVADGGDMLEQISNFEAARAEQIRNSLLIAGALIEVTADMETSTKTMSQHSVDAKNKFSEVDDSEHETSTPVSVAAPAAEPGVVANTNVAISTATASGGPASGVATEKTKEKSMVDYGRTDTTTSTLAGACHVVGATVRVPHSYFAAAWKSAYPKHTEGPSDEELKAFVTEELEGIRATVTALTKLKSAEDITVRDYYDLDPTVGGPVLAMASPSAASNLTLLATGHARELAIGVLAITSLFMVSRMVKKAAPSPLMLPGAGGLNLMVADDDVQPTVPRKKTPPKVIGGEEVAAEVGDSGAIMFGHELDADVLETSQMIEQVAGFVKDNPDAAAQMIGRWMSRD